MPLKAIVKITEYSWKYIERMWRNLWNWESVTVLKLFKLRASRLLIVTMTEIDLNLKREIWFINN